MVGFGSACSVEPVYMETAPAGKGSAKKENFEDQALPSAMLFATIMSILEEVLLSKNAHPVTKAGIKVSFHVFIQRRTKPPQLESQ